VGNLSSGVKLIIFYKSKKEAIPTTKFLSPLLFIPKQKQKKTKEEDFIYIIKIHTLNIA
jgi:hypothetical protein